MEGQRVGRNAQRRRDLSRRPPLRARLHQQSEHVEPIVLRERPERRDRIRLFHISMDIETFA
jgi:hypothetical protein